jgi:hypothetical protein
MRATHGARVPRDVSRRPSSPAGSTRGRQAASSARRRGGGSACGCVRRSPGRRRSSVRGRASALREGEDEGRPQNQDQGDARPRTAVAEGVAAGPGRNACHHARDALLLHSAEPRPNGVGTEVPLSVPRTPFREHAAGITFRPESAPVGPDDRLAKDTATK